MVCLSQPASIVEYCVSDDKYSISILHASLSNFLLEKASSSKVSHHEWLSFISSADTASSNPSQKNRQGAAQEPLCQKDCPSVL